MMMNAISLGAGVQSSTMALMANVGKITPMPDCAIFADTQAEPAAVYEWLNWLEAKLSFPVYRVTAGDLTSEIAKKRPNGLYRIVPIPAYVKNLDGNMGGLLNRSCTRDFKIYPIRKQLRALLNLTGKHSPKIPVVALPASSSTTEHRREMGNRCNSTSAASENRWIPSTSSNRRGSFAARLKASDSLSTLRGTALPGALRLAKFPSTAPD